MKPIPGIEPAFGFDRPVWVNLLGPDPETMTKLIGEFAEKVAKIPGIADLEISEKAKNPALSIRLNNDVAADLGITVQQVGATMRPLLAGDTVSYWLAPDGNNYEVNVQLPKDGRQLSSDIGNLFLTTNKKGPDGEARMVPLRQVAEIVPSTSPQIIKRQELQRRVALYANAEGRPSGDVNSDVAKVMKEFKLPPGYRFDVGGQAKDQAESFQAALAALGLAVIFIYLILASQFASFTQPVAIMMSLPLSLIGVFLALLLTGTTLNLFSMIGFIMLMGLVTKNGILLVDFANRARRGGASLHDSLLKAGQVRLRPIMMTTAAMIAGMTPLALGLGEGGETQAPMGRAIIGGVITSTLLTLVVIPVLYTYLDRFRRMAQGAARGARRRPTRPRRHTRAPRTGSRARPIERSAAGRHLAIDREIMLRESTTPDAPIGRSAASRASRRANNMDIEQARFNMVEQQIRTWEVLDQDVLDLLFSVRREEFVPAAYATLAFADLEIPLRRRREDVDAEARGARAAGARAQAAASACSRSAPAAATSPR